jgi:polyhydroxybutyrate depolymerase
MPNRRSAVCACVATLGLLLAGCGGKGSVTGAGGAAGESAAGGEAIGGTGGVLGTGGIGGTGGVLGTGGRQSTGGRTGIGGGVAGGAVGTGGRQSTGGRTGTGGASAGTGGAVADAAVVSLGDGSAGCGLSGAPTGNLSAQSITVGDRTRTYALTVPKNYASSTIYPVIFAWHGMGGSGSVARSYFHVDSAVANRAIVVYPDGLPMNDGSTGWDLTGTGIDVAFFDALLAYVNNTYCIDRNRLFATGHSYGGFFTNVLGCYRGDVLRAIAPVAGNPPMSNGRTGVTCVGNVAAVVIHGQNDPTVDYTRGGVGGRDFWAGKNGCSTTVDPVPITPPACLESQGCQPDLPVVFCTHTEEHDWPTANGKGCSADGGVCFDAGSTIWTFFSRFN